jgi:hypothetical protein
MTHCSCDIHIDLFDETKLPYYKDVPINRLVIAGKGKFKLISRKILNKVWFRPTKQCWIYCLKTLHKDKIKQYRLLRGHKKENEFKVSELLDYVVASNCLFVWNYIPGNEIIFPPSNNYWFRMDIQ